jgi:uncharacterized protein YwqG
MKKNKKNKLFKFVFMIFFLSFVVIYFSELTGYYEYRNHQRTVLTEEQVRKFEEDVSNGVDVDLNQYLVVENKNYDNKLSKITSKLSDSISDIVESGVNQTFKLLSKIMEE